MNNRKILAGTILTCSLLIVIAFIGVGCSQNETPKPRGYIRIDLPEKSYSLFDTLFPYTFEYPDYASVEKDPLSEDMDMMKRFNVIFPELKGTLHFTYEPLDNNLNILIEDAVDFAYKHVPRASTISKTVISNEDERVFGTLFNIRGRQAASTYQFYLTDSIHHFLRGSLYLNTFTDNDSLKPVIDFLKQDVDHFINTFQWK